MSLRTLHLFAGCGGGILGEHLLVHIPVAAVELDPYCRARLFQRSAEGHIPTFPIFEDVKTFRGYRGLADVVSGGFPCQAFSSASRGRRTAEDLWPEMFRIIKEVEPRYVFAENVQRAPIQHAADQLAGLGYVVRCAEISSACLGAPHNRRRFWLLADSDHRRERPWTEHDEVARPPSLESTLWDKKNIPDLLGMDDGLAPRMVQQRAVGNGQVPAVVALAWRTLQRNY